MTTIVDPEDSPRPDDAVMDFGLDDLEARMIAIAQDGELSDEARRAQLLDALTTTRGAGRDRIRRAFEAGASGASVLAWQSELMDGLLRVLLTFALDYAYPSPNPTAGDRLALVALGGYGRGGLAPYSDIDLLFLIPYKRTARHEQVIEFILYLLWDLKLKVGQAIRSIDDCIRLSKDDYVIRTSLMEARFIYGEKDIFDDFRARFESEFLSGSWKDFVEGKLAERDKRHQRLGDSRYVLEPNIKEGKGGLRDLQTLFWIAKYVHGVDDVAALVDKRVLTKREARLFRRAEEFLVTLRCHLHYLSGRAEERLTFDLQPEIAARMGYTDHAGTSQVERFMKHYYLTAKDVGDLTRIFTAAILAEKESKPLLSLSRFGFQRKVEEDFVIDGGRLSARTASIFREKPVNLIRVFRIAQERDLDIHPRALRAITRNLDRINPRLRNHGEANAYFMEMLTDTRGPERILRLMNEAGVLGRFIPDFGRIVAQTQHDMYHVYTVDEHTIRALGILHGIESGALAEDHPLATRIIHKIVSRRVLYTALMLHDIAKGRGGSHSELGAEVAEELCPRLGLDEAETETVAWLVRHHLVFSAVAQKRDLNDPKTIEDFIAIVQSPERLRLLLVLTVADMRATGPSVFNAWKGNLMRQLYASAEKVMLGESFEEVAAAEIENIQARLRDALSDWSEEDIEAHFERGPRAYWLAFQPDELERHARMIREAEREKAPLTVAKRVVPELAITEVTIYTPDNAGLFSKIAGAIALSGATVVNARIVTLNNGMALDTFWIQDETGGPFDRGDKLARLSVQLEQVLGGRVSPMRELAPRRTLPTRTHVFRVPPRVLVDNNASRTNTVIEVNGRDRPGLLSDVTRALTEANLQISSAKIATYGERAVDVFYVRDVFGMKVERPEKLAVIREKLMAALQDPLEDEAGPDTGTPTEISS